MTSRDRVILTLNHEPVDRIPRDLWVSSHVAKHHADEVDALLSRYAVDIARAHFNYPRGERNSGSRREVGQYTDAWGCTWQVPKRGVVGDLLHAPLADWSALAHYQPPLETLQRMDFSAVNQACAGTTDFVLLWTQGSPLTRLRALRGRDAALADLMRGTAKARQLLAMIHDFHCREMQALAESDVDGVVVIDDSSVQTGLSLAPNAWRDWLKPLYGQYCEILHARDKYVFFHCEQNIADLFGDLVELGADAIHAPLPPADFEDLAARYRGRVTFWGEIDLSHTLFHARPDDVRNATRRLQRALDYGRGGAIAQCTWHANVGFHNIAAGFEQWLQPVPMHA